MKDAIYFVFGVIVLIGVLSMLREETARRIRSSRYWIIGWLGYLLGLSFAFNLMTPVLNRLPIDDDVAIPIIGGSVFLVVTVLFFVNVYRLRRFRRSE